MHYCHTYTHNIMYFYVLYTHIVILEVLRKNAPINNMYTAISVSPTASSPAVPHVATLSDIVGQRNITRYCRLQSCRFGVTTTAAAAAAAAGALCLQAH